MKSPSKLKAGLLISLIGVPICAASTFGGAMVSFGLADGLLRAQTPVQSSTLTDALGWLVPIGGILGGAVVGVVITSAIVIDHFPFGQYRLRIVPKDNLTPEVFL